MATLIFWIVVLALGWVVLWVSMFPLVSAIDDFLYRRRQREGQVLLDQLIAAEKLAGSAGQLPTS